LARIKTAENVFPIYKCGLKSLFMYHVDEGLIMKENDRLSDSVPHLLTTV